MLELKWIHTRNMEDNDPQVYLIDFLRKDILKYASINPFKYLIRIDNELFNTLEYEIISVWKNFNKKILDVKIEPCNDCDNEYIIYKICDENIDYPDLDKWWEYLPLKRKANIYLNNKSGD